ncbi:MAG TPA: 4Fe-4S dicluster domain-containing protein [Fimbriimonadaceae bacterium]|nr:4Fe-4S dicluster domain-containing protein [Fimbriimonadaceae bacterium]
MQYGFVIDQESCIGCHACTVACKAENGVPVGDFRTWVKYVDAGKFPEVKRHFLVQRCNHCTNPPCVAICPVNALTKRADGIVDVDRDACIGCRACMQACPYDALYMNDDLKAVEKCHFCAHRVEQGMEPACVTVCPVGAIIPGDFHDADSPVSRFIKAKPTKVRGEQQGTGPNVRYYGSVDAALRPGRAARGDAYLWSERPNRKPEAWPASLECDEATVAYDADHRIEWGWPVAAYLVTKSIAAGVAMFAPFARTFGIGGFAANYLPEIVALFFTLVTTFFLVEDLGKPMAFLRMVTRPNWNSWLVKGAVALGGFSALLVLSVLSRFAGLPALADVFRVLAALGSLVVAGYTALLFAQCKGRDLWESSWLLPHLIALAAQCGAAFYLVFAPLDLGMRVVFVLSTIAHFGLALYEWKRPHATDNATQAAAFLSVVRLGPFGAFRDGLLASAVLAVVALLTYPPVAFVPVLFGLFLYEHAYVRAAQLPPLS